MIKTALKSLLSLIVPKQCLACLRIESMEGEMFCLPCYRQLPRLRSDADNKAAMIGKVNLGEQEIRTHSLLFYYKDGLSKTILHQIKYHNKRHLARYMGSMIADMYVDHISMDDILVPVPLHPKKENVRGYNQTVLLSQGITKKIEAPIRTDILKRVINNSSQTQKTAAERSQAMKKTYALTSTQTKVDPKKTYIIVDDVITTGATIAACAELLRQAGAVHIKAVSLAVAV